MHFHFIRFLENETVDASCIFTGNYVTLTRDSILPGFHFLIKKMKGSSGDHQILKSFVSVSQVKADI